MREQDVPGRKPNIAERQGVMEDYILTDAKIKDPHASPAAATPPATAEQPTGTSGMAAIKMFEVRGLDDERLQGLVGQRVEITGSLKDTDVAERAREKANPAGEPAGDLPELQATAIKKIEGTCPAIKQ